MFSERHDASEKQESRRGKIEGPNLLSQVLRISSTSYNLSEMDSFLSLIRAKRFDEAKQSEGWLKHRDPLLCWACTEGDLDTVKWFLSEGADPAFEKNAPLSKACEYGHTAVVKLLLGYTAVVAGAHEHRNRCLFAAQREEYEDIEALLLAIPAVAAGPSMRKWGYGLLDD